MTTSAPDKTPDPVKEPEPKPSTPKQADTTNVPQTPTKDADKPLNPRP